MVNIIQVQKQNSCYYTLYIAVLHIFYILAFMYHSKVTSVPEELVASIFRVEFWY